MQLDLQNQENSETSTQMIVLWYSFSIFVITSIYSKTIIIRGSETVSQESVKTQYDKKINKIDDKASFHGSDNMTLTVCSVSPLNFPTVVAKKTPKFLGNGL